MVMHTSVAFPVRLSGALKRMRGNARKRISVFAVLVCVSGAYTEYTVTKYDDGARMQKVGSPDGGKNRGKNIIYGLIASVLHCVEVLCK